MANAKMLPSGKWRVRAYVGKDEKGKAIYKSFTADTKRKAELLAIQYTDGSYAQLSDAKFYESMELFLDLRKSVLSPSTMKGYKSIERVLKNDCRSFCDVTTTSITSKDIQYVIDYYARNHSPKYCANIYNFIVSVIKMENQDAHFNCKLPAKKRTELYVPSEEEIKALIESSKDNPDLRIPILLGSCCGLRRSEICGLDIADLENDVIHIHQAKVQSDNYEWVIKQPKTYGSDRYIQIPTFIADEIRTAGRITKYTPESVSHAFWDLQKKLKMNHFRFHDLRHFAISIRHAIGIPDEYIMSDSGHTSNVIQNVYRHTLSEERKKMSEKTNLFLSTLFR